MARIPWHPSAWQVQAGKQEIRKHPTYKKFHSWLVHAAESGEVTRQEAVSMLPPLLLDVQPGHKVLDLCAAPGSKTSQIVEAVGTQGLVLANDVNRDRAYLLVKQVKRLANPSLLVTSHDGTLFPSVYGQAGAGSAGAAEQEEGLSVERLYFDRVLADVPCSGDGTLRKNAAIWAGWSHVQAIGLHSLQIRLLERAISLIDPLKGGRVVYSTCSMNPLENEAVLSNVINSMTAQGEERGRRVVLRQASLPGLKARPGLTSWPVVLKDGKQYARHEDIADPVVAAKVPRTLFVTPVEGLERCIRVLPQDQDTGAFFVAVLDVLPVEGFQARNGPQRAVVNLQPFHYHYNEEDPFRVLSKEFMAPILDFYGLNFDPALGSLQFVSRSNDENSRSNRQREKDSPNYDPSKPILPKSILAISPLLSSLYAKTSHGIPADGLRIVNLGVRCFDLYETSPLECKYRLVGEGLDTLLPFMRDGDKAKERIFDLPTQLMKRLVDNEDGIPRETVQEALENQQVLPSVGGAIAKCSSMMVAVWVSTRTVKAYVPKIDRPSLLAHLGDNDDSNDNNPLALTE